MKGLAVVGSGLSRRTISTTSVAAPVPGCSESVSRPATARESAVIVPDGADHASRAGRDEEGVAGG